MSPKIKTFRNVVDNRSGIKPGLDTFQLIEEHRISIKSRRIKIEFLLSQKINQLTTVEEIIRLKIILLSYKPLKKYIQHSNQLLGRKYTLYGQLLIIKHYLDHQQWNSGCYLLANDILNRTRNISCPIITSIQQQVMIYKYIFITPHFDRIVSLVTTTGSCYELFIFSIVNDDPNLMLILIEKLNIASGADLLKFLLHTRIGMKTEIVIEQGYINNFTFDGQKLIYRPSSIELSNFEKDEAIKTLFQVASGTITSMSIHLLHLHLYGFRDHYQRYIGRCKYLEISFPHIDATDAETRILQFIYNTWDIDHTRNNTFDEFATKCINVISGKYLLTEDEAMLYDDLYLLVGRVAFMIDFSDIFALMIINSPVFHFFKKCINVPKVISEHDKAYLALKDCRNLIEALDNDGVLAFIRDCDILNIDRSNLDLLY